MAESDASIRIDIETEISSLRKSVKTANDMVSKLTSSAEACKKKMDAIFQTKSTELSNQVKDAKTQLDALSDTLAKLKSERDAIESKAGAAAKAEPGQLSRLKELELVERDKRWGSGSSGLVTGQLKSIGLSRDDFERWKELNSEILNVQQATEKARVSLYSLERASVETVAKADPEYKKLSNEFDKLNNKIDQQSNYVKNLSTDYDNLTKLATAVDVSKAAGFTEDDPQIVELQKLISELEAEKKALELAAQNLGVTVVGTDPYESVVAQLKVAKDNLAEYRKEQERLAEAPRSSYLDNIVSSARVADDELNQLSEKYAELKQRQKDMEKAFGFKPTGTEEWQANEQQILQYEARIKELKKELSTADRSAWLEALASSSTVADQHIRDVISEIDRLKKEAADLNEAFGGDATGIQEYTDVTNRLRELQTELSDFKKQQSQDDTRSEYLKNLADESTISSRHIRNLVEELEQLKERQKDLNEAFGGNALGVKEYEDNARRINEINAELKEYQSEMDSAKHRTGALGVILEGLRGIAIATFSVVGAVAKTAFSGIVLAAKGAAKLVSAAFRGVVSALKWIFKSAVGIMLSPFKKLGSAVTSFGKRLKTALLQGLIFRPIRTAMFNLVKTVGDLVKTDASLAKSFAEVKGAALTAFQPLLTAVVPIIQKVCQWIILLIGYISKLLSLLFGIGAASKTAAKNMYDQANATKAGGSAADKFLASWDTIQQVGSKSGGGADTEAPSFDFNFDGSGLGKLGEFVGKLKEKIAAEDWYGAGMEISKGLNDITKSVDDWVVDTFNPWVTNAAQHIADLMAGLVDGWDPSTTGKLAADILNGLTQAFSTLFNPETFRTLGEKIGTALNTFFENYDFAAAGTGISNFALSILNAVIGFLKETDWQQIGEKIKEFLKSIDWTGLTEAIFEGIGAAIAGLADLIWGLVEEAWHTVVQWWYDVAYEDGKFTIQGLLDGIVWVIDGIVQWIDQHIFKPFFNAVKSVFGIASPAKSTMPLGEYIAQGLLNGVASIFVSIYTWIKEHIFDPVINAIKNVFGINRDGGEAGNMKPLGQAIGDGLASGFDSTVQKIKDVLNKIITAVETAINWCIDKLNALSFDVPDWVPGIGGRTFGFNISRVTLPRLAQGSVINPGHEFAAILGDNRYEQEVVSPLSTMKEALMEALAESGYNRGGNITMQIDGKTFARITNPYLQKEQNRIGISVVGGSA